MKQKGFTLIELLVVFVIIYMRKNFITYFIFILFFCVSFLSSKSLEAFEGLTDDEIKLALNVSLVRGVSHEGSIAIRDVNNDLVINPKRLYNNKLTVTVETCWVENLQDSGFSPIDFLKRELKGSNISSKTKEVYKNYGIDNLFNILKQDSEKFLKKTIKEEVKGEYEIRFNYTCIWGGTTTTFQDYYFLPVYIWLSLTSDPNQTTYPKDFNAIPILKNYKFEDLTLLSKNYEKKQTQKAQKNERLNKIYLEKTKSKDQWIGSILLGKSNELPDFNFCTTSSKKNGIMVYNKYIGYRLQGDDLIKDSDYFEWSKSNKYSLDYKKNDDFFEKVYQDLNSAFMDIKEKSSKCDIFIDNPENIITLKEALSRENFKSVLLKISNIDETLDTFAKYEGYKDNKQKIFANKINFKISEIKFLEKKNINTLEDFEKLKLEIKNTNYSDGPFDYILISNYITDKQSASSNNNDILTEKKQRLEREKLAAKKAEEELKKLNEQLKKQWKESGVPIIKYHIDMDPMDYNRLVVKCYYQDRKFLYIQFVDGVNNPLPRWGCPAVKKTNIGFSEK